MTDQTSNKLNIIKLGDVTNNEMKQNIGIVIDHFRSKFNTNPIAVIRVPGRVNLIGEHIDYCGFPVCPMALDKSIFFAVAPSQTSEYFIQASNVNEKYNFSHVEEYKKKLDCSFQSYGWISYILAGIQGVTDKNQELKQFNEPKKMLVAVHSTLPSSCGLSSSSALVCAAFIATCFINDIFLSKTEIASLCAECEQYIGTIGGGMDQAIALSGQKGAAKLVKFNPLRLKDVYLPEGAIVMIANTFVEKDKATSNDFNTRVVECRLACLILGKSAKYENWKKVTRLADVQKCLDSLSFHEIMILVEKIFHEEPYTKNEVCEILELTSDQLNELALSPNTYHVNSFKLKQRVTHVFEEADRVYTWDNWCSNKKPLNDLGSLMSKSHFSLQYLYECSHPELDKMVSIFMMSGAYGARLTGAGWGGCVVALVPENRILEIKKNLFHFFYKNKLENEEEMSKAIWIVTPGDGAEIYTV